MLIIVRRRKYERLCQAEIDRELDTAPIRDGDVQNAPFEVRDTSILAENGQGAPYEVEYRPALRSYVQRPAYEVRNIPVARELEAGFTPVPREHASHYSMRDG